MMKYTIKADVSVHLKILRSEFIGFLYRVEDAAQAQEILRKHQGEYQNATHNCYAYVLGYEAELQYYSDAGEPGGTAGKPILNSLLRSDLSGVLAVVTRYYGGIKLGVKGLIEAYSQATMEAVAAAELVEFQKYNYYHVDCDYAFLDTLRHHLSALGAEECAVQYAALVALQIRVPETAGGELREYLDGYKALGRLDYNAED
jgi:uncharacterized YigZ family protein